MSNQLAIVGDSGWTEIVGEEQRKHAHGRSFEILGEAVSAEQERMDAERSFDILGEAIKQGASFKGEAEIRAAASRPIVANHGDRNARDWQVDTGPVFAPAGSIVTATINPQVHFRGEKVYATDSSTTPGQGTRIMAIFVGQKSQRPANAGSTLTAFFSGTSLGNGIRWDTCQRALKIQIVVSFITTCTFDMSIFGKAVGDF